MMDERIREAVRDFYACAQEPDCNKSCEFGNGDKHPGECSMICTAAIFAWGVEAGLQVKEGKR